MGTVETVRLLSASKKMIAGKLDQQYIRKELSATTLSAVCRSGKQKQSPKNWQLGAFAGDSPAPNNGDKTNTNNSY